MIEYIKKHLGGWKVLAFLLFANMVYLLMLFVTIPMVMAYSGGMKLFDMMPAGYTLAYANTLLGMLGPAGRDLYLTRQLPLDMLYPGLSGIAYCLLMGWLLKQFSLMEKPARYLCLIPLVAGLFDYLENISIIVMIRSYPVISGFQAGMANFFTVTKSMVSALFFIILIFGITLFLFKKLLSLLR